MSPAPARSVRDLLDLLEDPAFRSDAERFLAKVAPLRPLRAGGPPPSIWYERVAELAEPFRQRWHVLPPTTGELLDAVLDPRRKFVDAVASGRWGLLPIFPWITDKKV